MWLASFWLALSLASGLLIGAATRLAGSAEWMPIGAIFALMLVIPGLVVPRLVWVAYAIWRRLALEYSRVARTLVTGICFYTIFVAVSLTGRSALKLDRPRSGESLWVRRKTLAAMSYESPYEFSTDTDTRAGGSLKDLLSWAARTRQYWVVFLVPFLVLLQALEPGKRNVERSDIYTLY